MKQNKHMRLPNGFGQISKIKSKKLRKPYRAMVTVGKTETGRPIVRLLKPEAYFETYNDAYIALIEYNKDPYDLTNMMTVEKLYKEWLPKYLSTVTPGTARALTSAWTRCDDIKPMLVRELRTRHCKLCIESGPTPIVQRNIQRLLNKLLDYAIEYDLIDRNYSRPIKIAPYVKEGAAHEVFTDEELELLWQNINNSTVRMILIQCYSGWRPSELCDLRSENINLENWTMTGGMKTEAGKNRIVPIHEKIRGLVSDAMADGGKYLFNPRVPYSTYLHRFHKVLDDLKFAPGHKPHDPRKTFITMCKRAKVDEYAIKYMAGHTIKDITENIYTERGVDFLTEELSKV